ncbi:hybrid sensor histidine kinase/response regulator transcription factor [Sphingobacterium sp. MYb388]|uniref:hybrid sensor histidine kinase/response regulator transcription factor n=1 Tax=Sphingobacterium sp. MYb388 TaxID=2745437 RepID=UPI00309588C5
MRYNLLCLLIFLLLCFDIRAQSSIEYLGIDHGLSNDFVTDIYQDKDGFMWFGTFNGLNRFDGYEFKIFKNNPLENKSLPDNRITDILEDQTGNLYIATKGGLGVFDMDRNHFTRADLVKGDLEMQPIDFSIHQLEKDNDGQLFATSGKAGLLTIKNTAKGLKAHTVPLYISGKVIDQAYSVSSICKTFDGRLMLMIHGVGLAIYDRKNNCIQVLAQGDFNATLMTASSDGGVWFSNGWSVTYYDWQTNAFQYYSFVNGLSNKRIVNLYFGQDRKIWVCTDGDGIQKINVDTKKIEKNTGFDEKQLTGNAVVAIYEDNERRKWLGTIRGGVNVIDPQKGKFQLVKHHSPDKKVSSRDFISVLEQADHDHIWVGTDGSGLLKWNLKQKVFVPYPNTSRLLSERAFVTGLIQDDHHQLWIGTYDSGIFKLDMTSGQIKSYTCYYPQTEYVNAAAWRLFKDSRKRIWASTLGGGVVYLFDVAEDQFKPLNLPIYDVLTFFEEKEDILWMGSWSELIRLDLKTRRFKTYAVGTPVRFIKKADRHHLWIGTEGGGLRYFNIATGQSKTYTEKEGLPSNTLLNALNDDFGNLWISTYHGLSKFDTKVRSFQNFYTSDGLQSNQFNYNAALKLSDGHLVFGGIRGFNLFQSRDLLVHTVFPALKLTQLQINNNPYGTDKRYGTGPLNAISKLTIPYNQAVLSFSFAALDYSFSDRIKYAYFLEGWDKDWNYVDKQRSAYYSHLKEGIYTLRIKSTNANGEWNPSERTIVIQILPPWWRTGWAYTGYGMCVVAALYLYFLYVRHRALLLTKLKAAEFERDKENELTEKKVTFFTHIVHEIRTPLTLIINPIKELLKDSEDRVTDYEELQDVYRHSKRLLNLVDKLLLFRKSEGNFDELSLVPLDIVHLVQEVFLCFRQIAHSQNISYTLKTDIEAYPCYGDFEKLEICFFNLLQNALKYTQGGGMVTVHMNSTVTGIRIEISDSGNGTPTLLKEDIFKPFQRDFSSSNTVKEGFGIGLFLVKKFVEIHQGEISYYPNADRGMTFCVDLPQHAILNDEDHILEVSNSAFSSRETMGLNDPVMAEKADRKNSHYLEGSDTSISIEREIILLVDDHADIRNYIYKLFQDRFYVVQAENGEQAVAILQKIEPHIIISDIMMEGGSGIDLCHKIKKSNQWSHIPLILLTASSSSEIKLKGIEGGADDYITKPFDKDMLMARVDNLIQNRNRLHEYFHSHITLQSNDHKIPVEYKEFLEKVIQAVEAHLLEEDFTVKVLAETMGMSHSNLYRQIKAISGKSANEFIRYIRLRRAAQILITTKANVNESAYQVGFRDVKHFRQQFTKLFGCTPSEYRKRYPHLKKSYALDGLLTH